MYQLKPLNHLDMRHLNELKEHQTLKENFSSTLQLYAFETERYLPSLI